MIDRLNEKITFQKNAISSDEFGNRIQGWEDYFTCWCYVDTRPKNESGDVVTKDERSITFEVRACSELLLINSTEYRVKFHDELYGIESVDMMNWSRKSLKILCGR